MKIVQFYKYFIVQITYVVSLNGSLLNLGFTVYKCINNKIDVNYYVITQKQCFQSNTDKLKMLKVYDDK